MFETKKISLKHQATIYRQLSVMIEGGISINHALSILQKLDAEAVVKSALTDTQKLLQQGNSSRYSFEKTRLITNPLYIQLLEIGEETGEMSKSFKFIADSVEENLKFRSLFTQALTYPVIVLSVALISILILILFVVPSFAEVFRNMNAELPFITQFIMDINYFLVNYGILFLIALSITGVLIFRSLGITQIKRLLDKWSLTLPYIKNITLLRLNYEFCTGLSLMVGSGVPLLKALQILSKNATNFFFGRQLGYFAKGLERGERLSSLSTSGHYISPIVQQMISVGEETAELPSLLVKTAELFRFEINAKIEVFGSIIEPVLIIFLGIIVGLILISMYLPLFETMNSYGGM